MVSSTSGSVMLYIRLYIPPSEALCSLLFELLLLLLLPLRLLLLLQIFYRCRSKKTLVEGVVVVVGLVLPSLSLSCCGAKMLLLLLLLIIRFRSYSARGRLRLFSTRRSATRTGSELNKNKPSMIKVSLDIPPSNAAFVVHAVGVGVVSERRVCLSSSSSLSSLCVEEFRCLLCVCTKKI